MAYLSSEKIEPAAMLARMARGKSRSLRTGFILYLFELY